MSIITHEAGREAAVAIARRTGLGPVHVVHIDLVSAHVADLLVVAHPKPDAIERLAHDATVPLLVVRDVARFVAWAAGETSLRVSVGWDDTATTAAALAPVIRLRHAGDVDVDVVHVYFPDEASHRYGLRVESMVDPSAPLEALLRRDIAHQLGEALGKDGVTITPTRGLGHIGAHLLDRAEASAADLVVVGNHHRSGLRRLSSVAEHVLTQATASVLLVPLRPAAGLDLTPGFEIAVVATDGTAFANRAIPYAYRMIPERGEVHLIRVVEASEPVDDRALVDGLLALRPSNRPATRTVAHIVRDRDPAHAIAVAAERIGADVVCIASHARTGITRVLIGSVTDRLLHVCRRPVLVLHPLE